MWISALWLLVVVSAEDDVVVPLCCPDGQGVGGIEIVDKRQVIYCNDTVDPAMGEFEPLNNLSRRHHPITCPVMIHFPDGYKSNNITFGEHVKYITSQPYDYDLCFAFTNDTVLLYTCSDHISVIKQKTVNWKFTSASGLSAVFLLITVAIYILVKPLRRNPHSPYIVSLNLSLIMNYVSRIVLQLFTVDDEDEGCVYMAFVHQFCSLAAFFWMNALSLDIHTTIRRMLPPRPEKSPVDKKFLLISLYAWGIPLIFTTLAVIFQFSNLLPSDSPFKPHVARWFFSCFFTGTSRWYYHKIPIGVSVTLSIALFIATAVILYQHERTMASVQVDSRYTNNKRCYILYLKLFVIMGIGWVLSWTVDTIIKRIEIATRTTDASVTYINIVLDLVFCIQGFLIFCLLVCKRRTLLILREEIPFLRTLKLPSWATGAKACEDSSSNAGQRRIRNAVSNEAIL